MLNSLVTTVATPSKWPGRELPHSPSVNPATETVVSGSAGTEGYISSTGGAKTTSTPSAPAMARSPARSRGYRSRSSAGPNCSGLTKSETTTVSWAARAARINERWPSWKAPIVGTNPTVGRGPGGVEVRPEFASTRRSRTSGPRAGCGTGRSNSATTFRSSPGAGCRTTQAVLIGVAAVIVGGSAARPANRRSAPRRVRGRRRPKVPARRPAGGSGGGVRRGRARPPARRRP